MTLRRQFPLQVAGKTADEKFFCGQREELLECSIRPRRPQRHLLTNLFLHFTKIFSDHTGAL
uniref:Uncharacterized protein n=1 Tax=Arundo donax TaxID=35708 RepID=A0A0A9D4M5_ARUDO